MGVRHRKPVRVWKVIATDVVNEVRKLCFESFQLFALFFYKGALIKQNVWRTVVFCSYELPTRRVGRSVTRLTVYWAFLCSVAWPASSLRAFWWQLRKVVLWEQFLWCSYMKVIWADWRLYYNNEILLSMTSRWSWNESLHKPPVEEFLSCVFLNFRKIEKI